MRDAQISRDRLRALLDAMRNRRIAIVGDAMLDVYLRGDVERISPEAPVPVVRVRERVFALGGAANVLQNALAAGARATLVAAAGEDVSGRELRSMLARAGADVGHIVPVSRPTTTKTRLVARSQQVVRFDEEDDGDLTTADAQEIIARLDRVIANADALVFEDYNKGVLVPSVIEAAMRLAMGRGIPIVVDPKYKNFFAYRGATVFKPNRKELESALGAAVDFSDPTTLPSVLDRVGAHHLLLTMGEHGMLIIDAAGRSLQIPTTAREVYDVVGAGDTVTAYLATALAAGASMHEAAVIANYAAGVEVAKLGAATVTPEELLAAFDDATGTR